MRIALVCNDTRGGVQPYAALGRGLSDAGHDVCAVAPAGLASIFSDAGIAVAELSGGAELMDATRVAERGTIAVMRLMARELPSRLAAWTRETLVGVEGADFLVGGVGGRVVGLSVADRLGVPFVHAHLQPIGIRTATSPGVLLPWFPRGPAGLGWRLSQQLSDLAVELPFKRAMAQVRSQVLGLSGRSTAADGQPVLYGFSKRVVDIPERSRGVRRYATGYWTSPAHRHWLPPASLTEFLQRPGTVVSVGFGSMSSSNTSELVGMIAEAADVAGVRVVLLSGWAGLESVEPRANLYTMSDAPHDWLFSRVAAAVHHGGAGTTGAALIAGTPSVVVPFAVDQLFWASRVEALGAGPAPIPRRRLTHHNLADAIRRTISDPAMRARAGAIGRQLRAENGIGVAVDRLTEIRAPSAD